MPLVLTTTATVSCSHAARVTHLPSQSRVLVVGAPVIVQTDTASIIGCPFTIPTSKPSPCLTARWTTASARVFAGGTPVLTQASTGLGLSPEQAPQGPLMASVVQPRVQAI